MHDPKDSRQAGYEVTDINPRVVVTFGGVITILMFAALALMLLLTRGLEDGRRPMNTDPAWGASVPEAQIPPTGPRLQGNPQDDKRQSIARQRAALEEYALVDDTPGMERARIPIDLAISLVVEGALPYRQEPTEARVVPDEEHAETEIVTE